VLVFWSASQGGYFPRDWYPGALLLLAVLCVTAIAAPSGFRDLPNAARVALAALLAYTAWTYLSITWADAKGVAWDGANRTLLYFVLFALLARSIGERSAAVVIGTWSVAIAVLAVVVLVKLPGVIGDGSITGKGLEQPIGYTNANAAIWLMAAWPALLLAACRDVPPWLRGVLTAGVVILADTSLLSESRGTLVATGAVLIVLFALVPGRVRSFLALAPAAVAIAVTAPYVLHRANAAGRELSAVPDLGEVAVPVLLAALAAGAVAAVWGFLEVRRPPSESTWRTLHRAVAALGIAIVLASATAGLVAAGDPVDRVRSTWREFKQTGAPSPDSPGHLTAGFGGARYDYYRVALDVFEQHPLAGIGADNFADDYRARGTVGERPTSPHSLELRTLVQTGVIGAVLLFVALGAGFAAAHRALRGAPPLQQAVAAGGALTCLYWVIQGSADWFWEFPALGGAAFAFLGLAAAAEPQPEPGPAAARPRLRAARLAAAGGLTLALVAAASLAAPWTADIEVSRAAKVWRVSPAAAFRQLDVAADLNPLSERPGMEAGTIAVYLGRIARARRAFEQVVERNPRNAYATLELGAIASHEGRRADAMRLLRRALALSPNDGAVLSALDQAKAGRVDVAALTQQIFANARAYVQGRE
jgi:tetratricopeptide (TPR) repeat protein